MAGSPRPESSSFRDPSGFVFRQEGRLYRQVNPCYGLQYERLIQTGLYERLVERGLLIAHKEVRPAPEGAYKVLEPEPVDFVSYPYEWCLGQLREAALATLEIQQEALYKGMALKDASAFNIQFHKGRPVLIDTLSFELYEEGEPWGAYGQFCRHFVAPLVLMAHADVRLNRLSCLHIDGIPLDLASKLAPWRTRWNVHIASHLLLHANAAVHPPANAPAKKLSRRGLESILESLRSLIESIPLRERPSVWGRYYEDTNYSEQAMQSKTLLVDRLLEECGPPKRLVWDLGANTGRFSELASRRGWTTVAWDLDATAVERCYQNAKSRGDRHLLPLIQDLTNPSPGIGWANEERDALLARGPADIALALALVHHLAIGNNLPFSAIADFLSRACHKLIIEFVPKEDSQVQRMLASRRDIFDAYNQQEFEKALEGPFRIEARIPIEGSSRVLYRMSRRCGP